MWMLWHTILFGAKPLDARSEAASNFKKELQQLQSLSVREKINYRYTMNLKKV